MIWEVEINDIYWQKPLRGRGEVNTNHWSRSTCSMQPASGPSRSLTQFVQRTSSPVVAFGGCLMQWSHFGIQTMLRSLPQGPSRVPLLGFNQANCQWPIWSSWHTGPYYFHIFLTLPDSCCILSHRSWPLSCFFSVSFLTIST